MKPRLLDLFCGGGGAAMGYHRAGFEVVGVDVEPQPNYPFQCHQGDALSALMRLSGRWDAIHASPPCQHYSTLNAYNHKTYPDLVERVRTAVIATGLPYVIENVPQAPLEHHYQLCGGMFGLEIYRHRDFETSFSMMVPSHPAHTARCVRNGYLPGPGEYMSIHGGRHSKAWTRKAAEVMGVPWMQTVGEVCEAIPPAYTEHIGQYLLAEVNRAEREPA